jgi:hypothetical protein
MTDGWSQGLRYHRENVVDTTTEHNERRPQESPLSSAEGRVAVERLRMQAYASPQHRVFDSGIGFSYPQVRGGAA